MENEQTELDIGVGNKELEKLKPATVEIKETSIEKVGEKKVEKVKCLSKHPENDELIAISAVKYERNKKLVVSGLWLNRDEDDAIQKGSALAVFMENVGTKTLKELNGKKVETVLDDKGFLCFKAY